MQTEIEVIKHRLNVLESDYRELKNIIEPLQKTLIELNSSCKQIADEVREMKADIKCINAKPSKTLEYIFFTSIGVVITAIGTFIFNMIMGGK